MSAASSLDRKDSEGSISAEGVATELQDNQVEEIPSSKENTSSVFTIICSGFALISDGLQNNIMSLTNVVFAQLHPTTYNSVVSTRLSNSLTVGTIIGQLTIGLLCDLKGRKWGIILSTVFIVLGIALCTSSRGVTNNIEAFYWFFTVARGITGVGVGGEYPSSSTSAVEAANSKTPKQRGPVFVLVTNLVLSFGTPFACILYLIVFEAAGGVTGARLGTVWPVVFGISMIPPLAVFIFRLRMLNSTLYTRGAIQTSVPYKLTFAYYWKSLIGTAGAWFLYDIVVFPNGVFSSTIIASILKGVTGPALLKQTAQYQLMLGTIALPGVFIGAALVNRLGRRNVMMVGFCGYLIFGLSVGLAYERVVNNVPVFVVLYGLMQSSGNLGPGNMLGLISSESYATCVRGTLYGFSAAVGKVGAVVGIQTFTIIRTNLGPKWTFIIAAIIGVVGVLVTYFFVRNDLEGDLALEDAAFLAYLHKNGWKGQVGASYDDLEDERILVQKVEGGEKAE